MFMYVWSWMDDFGRLTSWRNFGPQASWKRVELKHKTTMAALVDPAQFFSGIVLWRISYNFIYIFRWSLKPLQIGLQSYGISITLCLKELPLRNSFTHHLLLFSIYLLYLPCWGGVKTTSSNVVNYWNKYIKSTD